MKSPLGYTYKCNQDTILPAPFLQRDNRPLCPPCQRWSLGIPAMGTPTIKNKIIQYVMKCWGVGVEHNIFVFFLNIFFIKCNFGKKKQARDLFPVPMRGNHCDWLFPKQSGRDWQLAVASSRYYFRKWLRGDQAHGGKLLKLGLPMRTLWLPRRKLKL